MRLRTTSSQFTVTLVALTSATGRSRLSRADCAFEKANVFSSCSTLPARGEHFHAFGRERVRHLENILFVLLKYHFFAVRPVDLSGTHAPLKRAVTPRLHARAALDQVHLGAKTRLLLALSLAVMVGQLVVGWRAPVIRVQSLEVLHLPLGCSLFRTRTSHFPDLGMACRTTKRFQSR